jgi:GGDEF domain-containing protein
MTRDEEIESLKEQVKLYRFDWLTGLKGRRDFDYDLRKKFGSYDFFLCYYDVNDLHRCNREKGFAEGDRLIRQVAEDIQHQAIPHTTYRASGDEFYAICCDAPTVKVTNATNVTADSKLFKSADDMLKFLDEKMIDAKKQNKRRRKDDDR